MNNDQSEDEIIRENVSSEVWKYVAKHDELGYEDARELMGPCIQHAYDNKHLHNPERGRLSTFIAFITKNYLTDLFRHSVIVNGVIVPMTEEIENAHMDAPEEISDADEFKNATKEIIRNTVQTLCEEARQFFEDFFNLEKLMNKKPTLNALRKYYNLKGISMGRRQFYELLWPKMLDKFNDAFYVACKDDPDILAWFLRKFLEGQRREDDKKRFIKNNKKGN